MIVITMTSWKKRINNCFDIVKMIMKNTIKPDMLYLNLSDDEFKNLRKIMTTEYSQVLAQVIIERRNAYQQLMADSEIAMREGQSAYAEVSKEQGETMKDNILTPMDWLKYKAGDKLGWYEKLFHGLGAADEVLKTKKAAAK